jgi:hypothetical protein
MSGNLISQGMVDDVRPSTSSCNSGDVSKDGLDTMCPPIPVDQTVDSNDTSFPRRQQSRVACEDLPSDDVKDDRYVSASSWNSSMSDETYCEAIFASIMVCVKVAKYVLWHVRWRDASGRIFGFLSAFHPYAACLRRSQDTIEVYISHQDSSLAFLCMQRPFVRVHVVDGSSGRYVSRPEMNMWSPLDSCDQEADFKLMGHDTWVSVYDRQGCPHTAYLSHVPPTQTQVRTNMRT